MLSHSLNEHEGLQFGLCLHRILCVRTAMYQMSLRIYAGSSEHLLLAYAQSKKKKNIDEQA